MCLRNKDHFLKLGDVASASKFETQAQHTRKDLDVIQTMWKRLDPLPRFHYETRIFSIIQCNTDLADNDLEVDVIRGVNLPGKPDDLDSYVKVELPFPSDNPQRAKSHTLRGTNNPEYKESFKFEINRKSRALARVFKRHSLKVEVWSKGGFLRSDAQIGTVSVKLVDLEKVCTLHESYDLMDGRKACGGKLELKVRIRDPLLAKQVEEVKDRWLVID
ncbi:coiled-coil and C2 domain-containing protein 1-like, partial [Limulus polyphemus]|uniref:Coiled-coil and C2 domain-containing protein 1-like n=1 Tax=Limulus polyphemus TaxID=6850 RepID=A0ABM1BW47_LIMPO